MTLKRYITAIMLLLAAGIYTDACAQTKLGTGIRKLFNKEKQQISIDAKPLTMDYPFEYPSFEEQYIKNV